MKHKNEKPIPPVSEWEVIKFARRCANKQLEFYRQMMKRKAHGNQEVD